MGLGALVGLVIGRDLRLALRHWDQVLQPLIFFVIVTTLFSLIRPLIFPAARTGTIVRPRQ